VIEVVALATGFVAMEAVSYAAHRWVMHGPAMGWHASHHAPSRDGWERNDLFPIAFSVPVVGLFAAAGTGIAPAWTWWAAAGVSAYGAAYLAIHEQVIHRRIAAGIRGPRCLSRLRIGHAAHHLDGGEPYGMLLPFVSSSRRRRLAELDRPAVDGLLVRPFSRRPTRWRL
jgi:beta-carotene 3-hydroxylase